MADRAEMIAAAKQKAAQAKQKAAAQKIARKAPKLVEMPEPTGNPEVDSLADLDEVQRGFRERAKNEDRRFELATDSEYWFAMCFQTREQKEAFLKAMEWFELGDKYIDGQAVAKQMGVELPDADVPYRADGKIDKDWLSFVGD